MMTLETQTRYLKKREKLKYMIVDFEVENHKYKGRLASPFDDRNWIVMAGWKVQGDLKCSSWFQPTNVRRPLFIPDDVNMLVGHNFKFDLLWMWHTEEMRNFIKRGGRVWDTQTAEYLIRGMTKEYHMNSMDDIIESYGGRTKLDEVSRLWKEEGALTSEIDPKMLEDYLVGTKEEERNSGDIGNTELIFKGQWNTALKQKQIPMIEERMRFYLAAVEAEYNGLHIDTELGESILEENLEVLKEYRTQLDENLPKLPDGCVFNWGSSNDVSCFLFGGTKPYKVREPIVDALGNPTFSKGKLKLPILDESGNPLLNKSGKNKGEVKTKLFDVPDLAKPKMKYFDKGFRFNMKIRPLREWKGNKVTQWDEAIYSVGADTMKYLKETRTESYIKDYLKYTGLAKDITTYFRVVTEIVSEEPTGVDKEGNPTYTTIKKEAGQVTVPLLDGYKVVKQGGMLNLVGKDGKIHHTLNTNSTVTGRLSSKNPNMQNIPKGNKSKVKKIFISRFGPTGLVSEVDYSQLEVVILGALSQDPQLIRDLLDKIDFHCKRVALKYKSEYGSYENVMAIRADEKKWEKRHDLEKELNADESLRDNLTDEEIKILAYVAQFDEETYSLLDIRRTACKILSFQKQYGAGAKTIAETVGMPVAEVEEMLEIEDATYPGVVKFNEMIENHVNKFKRTVWIKKYMYKAVRASWQAPSGTIYTWDATTAPSFLQKQGITHSFSPPELKNYPIQGTGGEAVQIALGRLFQELVRLGYWSGGDKPYALFTNTVHDCAWFDFRDKKIADVVLPVVIKFMEDIPAYYKELFDYDMGVPFPVEAEIGPNMADQGHWNPDKEAA